MFKELVVAGIICLLERLTEFESALFAKSLLNFGGEHRVDTVLSTANSLDSFERYVYGIRIICGSLLIIYYYWSMSSI